MEEMQPQDLEDLLQELEAGDGAGELLAPEVETRVRVCPECGKQNLEDAWHCIDCGTTLSLRTLRNLEDGQPSGLSSISPYFEQDVEELLHTTLQDGESVVWGCNITRISSRPPFQFGYFLVTSRRLICVGFESEVTGQADQLLGSLLGGLLSLIAGGVVHLGRGISGQGVRPKRPWIGSSPPVPAVNYPSYPLTPKELASRTVAVYDLESLVSAAVESAWFGGMLFISLAARFHRDRRATFTFYSPHEGEKAYKLLAAWL